METVTVNSKTYTLKTDLDFTGRLFANGRDYHDAQDGESYDVEFGANAADGDTEVWVTWEREAIKGQEPELDSNYWDWENGTRVVEI